MPSRLAAVWPRTWREIWAPLGKSSFAPDDMFAVLVRAIAPRPIEPLAPAAPPPEAYDGEGILVDPEAVAAGQSYLRAFDAYRRSWDRYETAISGSGARSYFRDTIAGVSTERAAIEVLEQVWAALGDLELPELRERYRELAGGFVERYSLRYEIRAPFTFHATLPGLFTQLVAETKALTANDEHLAELFGEFEEALSDLRRHQTPARMKTCLQKQFNLLEAFGAQYPGVTGQTLGAMCDQLDWPHATIKEVGKKLYGFRSNYPGLGHGGDPAGALRSIQMRDFVSLSLILAAFTPYVAHGLDADRCYFGG